MTARHRTVRFQTTLSMEHSVFSGLQLGQLGITPLNFQPLLGKRESSSASRLCNYETWLKYKLPNVATAPLAERHRRLGRFFEALKRGETPSTQVEIWPRGGAKSSSAVAGVAFVGDATRPKRYYCLYVSGTQSQADRHVQAVATLLEKLGVERKLNKYGHSKGWRRNQVRGANGFNVEALGLDVAVRGIKLDEFRPDLIIFDDIDSLTDSPLTTEKKLAAITKGIIPAGATNCAYLFIQNLISADGVLAQMVDGRADFLNDRNVPAIELAVNGLEWAIVEDPKSGKRRYKITSGVPTWEGQSLRVCEKQINDWGLTAFLAESQHEVGNQAGYFFDEKQFRDGELPENLNGWVFCRAWDYAATQGGGDYTVGVLMGRSPEGLIYVVDVQRGQLASNNVRRLMVKTWLDDWKRYGAIISRMPQDPGAAGKSQTDQFQALLSGEAMTDEDKALFGDVRPQSVRHTLRIKPVTGKKAIRARGYADAVNLGNVVLCPGDWRAEFKSEHRRFREDETHLYDDQIDAAADAFNELDKPKAGIAGRRW